MKGRGVLERKGTREEEEERRGHGGKFPVLEDEILKITSSPVFSLAFHAQKPGDKSKLFPVYSLAFLAVCDLNSKP